MWPSHSRPMPTRSSWKAVSNPPPFSPPSTNGHFSSAQRSCVRFFCSAGGDHDILHYPGLTEHVSPLLQATTSLTPSGKSDKAPAWVSAKLSSTTATPLAFARSSCQSRWLWPKARMLPCEYAGGARIALMSPSVSPSQTTSPRACRVA